MTEQPAHTPAAADGSPACPHCSSQRFRMIARLKERSLYACGTCGLASRWPKKDDAQLIEYYAREYYHNTHKLQFDERRLPVYRNDFERATRDMTPGSLLDVGCGLGHFVKMAGDMGWKAMGTELAPAVVEQARTQHRLDVIQAGWEQVAALDRDFDVITLWNVLDQMNNPLKAVDALRRKLAPGGRLIVRVYNLTPRIIAYRLGVALSIPYLRTNFGIFTETVFTAASAKKAFVQKGYSRVDVYNSRIAGDVKGRQVSSKMLRLMQRVVEGVYALSAGRLCLGPSLLIVAYR